MQQQRRNQQDSKNGDFYVNTTAGTSSWTGLSTVGVNERLIYNGHTNEWDSYASTDLWQEAGDQLYPRNANADVLVGGTLPSAPNISLNASGSASFEGPVGIGTDSPVTPLSIIGTTRGIQYKIQQVQLVNFLVLKLKAVLFLTTRYVYTD